MNYRQGRMISPRAEVLAKLDAERLQENHHTVLEAEL